jgi:catechol 2,3-dioxygenase-like lactoylglutathione lyase family enzyme
MKFKKLTPNFSVRDVRETVKFYIDTLGFKLEMAVPDGSTTIENEISDKG